jgi:phosphoglycolate phosphatase
MKPTLLFDLDGTLIDSEAGILASIRYAFAAAGLAAPAAEILRSWIGPPLRKQLQQHLGHNDARVEVMVAHYREHFAAAGWADHRVIDGIDIALRQFARAGHRLAVVTSKIEPHARRIVASFAFASLFKDVIGATADGSLSEKPALIATALRRLGSDASAAVMIGDRRYDIEGARQHGMRSIGVLWGFGTRAELRAAGADALAATPGELAALI